VAPTNTLDVFPNPAASEVRVAYSIGSRSDVLLRLFDILGNEVARLANDAHNAGSYEVRWNVKSIPAGSYILQLSACGERISKVVEVMK
jgi:hypothetical protein